jgi:hypothetical protein
MEIELRVEAEPHPDMREGGTYKLLPIMGEGGAVVAYCVVDAETDATVMTIPAEQVSIER